MQLKALLGVLGILVLVSPVKAEEKADHFLTIPMVSSSYSESRMVMVDAKTGDIWMMVITNPIDGVDGFLAPVPSSWELRYVTKVSQGKPGEVVSRGTIPKIMTRADSLPAPVR